MVEVSIAVGGLLSLAVLVQNRGSSLNFLKCEDGFWQPTGSFQEEQVSFLKAPRLHSPIGMKLQKGLEG